MPGPWQGVALKLRHGLPEHVQAPWCRMIWPEAAQGQDHQAAGSPRRRHLARRGALGHDLHWPRLHGAARAIGQELGACRNLVGRSEQVGRTSACWLEAQPDRASELRDDGIERRPQRPEQRVSPWFAIQPARKPAQFFASDQPLQRPIDRRPASRVCKGLRRVAGGHQARRRLRGHGAPSPASIHRFDPSLRGPQEFGRVRDWFCPGPVRRVPPRSGMRRGANQRLRWRSVRVGRARRFTIPRLRSRWRHRRAALRARPWRACRPSRRLPSPSPAPAPSPWARWPFPRRASAVLKAIGG